MTQLPAKPQKTRDQLLSEFRKEPSDWRNDELMQNRAILSQKVQIEWDIGEWWSWLRADGGTRDEYVRVMLDVLGCYPHHEVIEAMRGLRSKKVRGWHDPIVIRDCIGARRAEVRRFISESPKPKDPEREIISQERKDAILEEMGWSGRLPSLKMKVEPKE
jgi:hypothetical protein